MHICVCARYLLDNEWYAHDLYCLWSWRQCRYKLFEVLDPFQVCVCMRQVVFNWWGAASPKCCAGCAWSRRSSERWGCVNKATLHCIIHLWACKVRCLNSFCFIFRCYEIYWKLWKQGNALVDDGELFTPSTLKEAWKIRNSSYYSFY